MSLTRDSRPAVLWVQIGLVRHWPGCVTPQAPSPVPPAARRLSRGPGSGARRTRPERVQGAGWCASGPSGDVFTDPRGDGRPGFEFETFSLRYLSSAKFPGATSRGESGSLPGGAGGAGRGRPAVRDAPCGRPCSAVHSKGCPSCRPSVRGRPHLPPTAKQPHGHSQHSSAVQGDGIGSIPVLLSSEWQQIHTFAAEFQSSVCAGHGADPCWWGASGFLPLTVSVSPDGPLSLYPETRTQGRRDPACPCRRCVVAEKGLGSHCANSWFTFSSHVPSQQNQLDHITFVSKHLEPQTEPMAVPPWARVPARRQPPRPSLTETASDRQHLGCVTCVTCSVYSDADKRSPHGGPDMHDRAVPALSS